MKKYILDNLKLKTGIKYDSRYAKVYNEQFKKNLNNPHIFCVKVLEHLIYYFARKLMMLIMLSLLIKR